MLNQCLCNAKMQQDVWKRVDKMYLDRTFNGQDWFGLRMTALKRKYKTTQEVYDAIKVTFFFLKKKMDVLSCALP